MRQRRLIIDGDKLHGTFSADVSDTLDYAAAHRNLPNPKGDSLRPRWTLPPERVEKLFTKYAGERLPAPAMDTEFWQWVDKQVMSDPDLAYYRLGNTSNPFFIGYNK